MTPERWQAAKALFDQALEKPLGSRESWLASATPDADLRHEVESLLDALSGDADRFERPAAISLDDLARHADAPAFQTNDRAGPYRLVREIGRGGMGVVYKAYRDDDQFKKRVAIKTISRGMDSDVILRRFRRERQILARLEHPNIARMLDGGVTESGQPYFVLEFVEGQPLDVYCDNNRLALRERLLLFRQVSSAVQYAHANLVIHRDLKPSNILVTNDGTVKLLDFGIAKLLRDDEPDDDGLTQSGLVPLTSGYASPEQVTGGAVTTASDVFSLGVVLYKVLAGRHPFAHDKPSGDETRRRIVEIAPVAPSAAVGAGDVRLRRALRDDLDAIVLMALRKEPERRYKSVEQLAEDIERYLVGLPVVARPDSVGYRARKFLRRNRTVVAAGVVATVAVLAGLTTTAWQARIARRERDRAIAEQARSERMSGFLQNMLGAADPSWYSPTERPGPRTTIGEIFDAAARRAETELRSDSATLADVLRTLGTANQALRRLDRAMPQLERARELHSGLYGPNSREVAGDEAELGWARNIAGDYPGAERWLRQSIANFTLVGDSTSDAYGKALANLGTVLAASGRPAEGEPFLRASFRHRQKLDAGSAANGILLGNLGLVFSMQGKVDSAEVYYRAALALFDRLRPREFFEEGFTLGNLAVDLIVGDRPAEAVPLARAQIAHFSKLLGAAHHNVAYGWVNLARSLHGTGDDAGALNAVQNAEEILEGANLPAGHPDFARTELIRGQILGSRGQLDEAERRLKNALEIRRARLSPGSTHTADAAVALGDLLTRRQRYAEAVPLYAAALGPYRTVFGPSNARTQKALQQLRIVCDSTRDLSACADRDTTAPPSPDSRPF